MLFTKKGNSELLKYPMPRPSQWQKVKTKLKRKSRNFKQKMRQILPNSNYHQFEYENEVVVKTPNVNMLDSGRSLTLTRVIYSPTICSPYDQKINQLYIKLRIEFYKTRKLVVETCGDVKDSIRKSLNPESGQYERYERDPIMMNDVVSAETVDKTDYAKIDEMIAKQPADALFKIRRPTQKVPRIPLSESRLEYNNAENVKQAQAKYGSERGMRLEMQSLYVTRVIYETRCQQMTDLAVKSILEEKKQRRKEKKFDPDRDNFPATRAIINWYFGY